MIPLSSLTRKSGTQPASTGDGCTCTYGLVNPPTPNKVLPLYEARLAQYMAGELVFCGCEHGRSYQIYFADKAAAYKTDGQVLAEKRLAQLWKNAGVPPMYAEMTIKGYIDLVKGEPGKAEAVAALRSLQRDAVYKDKFGLVLWGEPGVGKTGALSPLFVHLLRNGCAGIWVQYNELLAGLRDFESGQVNNRMERYKQIEYLFIDDLGDPAASSSATNYARDCLMQIIDYRKNHGKPILATSNLSPAQMEEQFHKRIVQRLAETCNVIEVKGRVLRK